ncbi:MAG: hypothetical protein ACK58L_10165 [Planctomycetota bacterium]
MKAMLRGFVSVAMTGIASFISCRRNDQQDIITVGLRRQRENNLSEKAGRVSLIRQKSSHQQYHLQEF